MGKGAPANPVRAWMWLDLAALGGDAQALPLRDRIRRELSDSQARQAQAEADAQLERQNAAAARR